MSPASVTPPTDRPSQGLDLAGAWRCLVSQPNSPQSLNFFDALAPARLRPSVTITYAPLDSIDAAWAEAYGSDSGSGSGDGSSASDGGDSTSTDDYAAAQWEEIKKHSVAEG